ncbi:unnamed protein product [Lymnaea stagnalis]|uniref:Uncharacterized protein n=1 Tax=Lymnaea stagnalis TaxID=6523 RepID=A0AAV2HAW1_LYMST
MPKRKGARGKRGGPIKKNLKTTTESLDDTEILCDENKTETEDADTSFASDTGIEKNLNLNESTEVQIEDNSLNASQSEDSNTVTPEIESASITEQLIESHTGQSTSTIDIEKNSTLKGTADCSIEIEESDPEYVETECSKEAEVFGGDDTKIKNQPDSLLIGSEEKVMDDRSAQMDTMTEVLTIPVTTTQDQGKEQITEVEDFFEDKGEEYDIQYIDEEADEEQQLLDVMESTNEDKGENVQVATAVISSDIKQSPYCQKEGKESNIKNQSTPAKLKQSEMENCKFEEISEGSIGQAEQEEVINDISADVEITGVSFASTSKSSKFCASNFTSTMTRVPFKEAESLEEVFFATENDDAKVTAEDKDNDDISDTSFSDHGGTNLSLEEISDDDLELSRKRRKSVGPGMEKIAGGTQISPHASKINVRTEEQVEQGITSSERNTSIKRPASEDRDADGGSSKKLKSSNESSDLIEGFLLKAGEHGKEPEQTTDINLAKSDDKLASVLDEPAFSTGLGANFKKEKGNPNSTSGETAKGRSVTQATRSATQATKSATQKVKHERLDSRDKLYGGNEYTEPRRRYELVNSYVQTEPRLLKGKIVQCNINPKQQVSKSVKMETESGDVLRTSQLLTKFKHLLPSSIPEKIFNEITSVMPTNKGNGYLFSLGPVTLSDMDSSDFRDVVLRGTEKFSLHFDVHCQGIFKATHSKHEGIASLIRQLKRIELGNRYMCMSFVYTQGEIQQPILWKATIVFMYEQDIQIESLGLVSDGKIRAKLNLEGVPKGISKDFIHLLFPEALSVSTSPGAGIDRVVTLGFSNKKMVDEVLSCYDLVLINGCQIRLSSHDPFEEPETNMSSDIVEESGIVIIKDEENKEISKPCGETSDKGHIVDGSLHVTPEMGVAEVDLSDHASVVEVADAEVDLSDLVSIVQVPAGEVDMKDLGSFAQEVTDLQKSSDQERMDQEDVALQLTDTETTKVIHDTEKDLTEMVSTSCLGEPDANNTIATIIEKNLKQNDVPDLAEGSLDTNECRQAVQNAELLAEEVSEIAESMEIEVVREVAKKSDTAVPELSESAVQRENIPESDAVGVVSESKTDETVQQVHDTQLDLMEVVANEAAEEKKDEHLEDVSDDDMMNHNKNTEVDDVVIVREDLVRRIIANIDLTNDESNPSELSPANTRARGSSMKSDIVLPPTATGLVTKNVREVAEKLIMTDGSLEVSMEVIDVSEDDGKSEKVVYPRYNWRQSKQPERVMDKGNERSHPRPWGEEPWGSSHHSKYDSYYSPRQTYTKPYSGRDYVSKPYSHDQTASRDVSKHRRVSSRECSPRGPLPPRESTRRDNLLRESGRSRSPSPRRHPSWYKEAESFRPSHYPADYYGSTERKYSSGGHPRSSYDKWHGDYGDNIKSASRPLAKPDSQHRDWHPSRASYQSHSSWQGDRHIPSRSSEHLHHSHESRLVHSPPRKIYQRKSRSQSYSDMSSSPERHSSPLRLRGSFQKKDHQHPVKQTSRSPISISSRSHSLSPVSKSPSPGRNSSKFPGKDDLMSSVKQFLHLAKDFEHGKRRTRSGSRESCSPQRRAHSPAPHLSRSPRREVVRSQHMSHSPTNPRSRSPPHWHRDSRSPDYGKSHVQRKHRSPSPLSFLDSRSKRYKSRDYYDQRQDSYHKDSPTHESSRSQKSRSYPQPPEEKSGQWPDTRQQVQSYSSSGDQQWQQSYGSYQSKLTTGPVSSNTSNTYNPAYPPPNFPQSGYPSQAPANVYHGGGTPMYQYNTPNQYGYNVMSANVPNPYMPPAPVPQIAHAYHQAFSVLQSAITGQPPPQAFEATATSSSNNPSSSKNKKSWSMGSNALVFQRILGNDGDKKDYEKRKKSGTIEKIGERERQERPKQTKEVRVLTSVQVKK